MADDLAALIRQSAGRLGIDPSDLATAISYETAGTFDPWKAGPTTQWGQHRGLIQWGEPQREKYGVTQDMPVGKQLEAAEKYLIDAGVKPGHGLLDVYSAINAGRVGRYSASDANNGGAPGTVADKVANQMVGHRLKANALLGGEYQPPMNVSPRPMGVAVGPAAPTTPPVSPGLPSIAMPAAADGGEDQLLASLQRLSAGMMPDEQPMQAPQQQAISLPGVARQRLARARAIAHSVRKNPLTVKV